MTAINEPLQEGKRQWQPREMRMMSEYLQKFNLWDKSMMQVRLGQPPSALGTEELDEADRRTLRTTGKFADAIYLGEKKVIIMESKIIPRMGPIEALLIYRRLFLSDPQFAKYHSKPVELRYIYSNPDPWMIALAEQLGIRSVHYWPKWMSDYHKILRPYERKGSPIPLEVTS